MPRPVHPRPGIPAATNEFQRDIQTKLVGDNKVTRDEARDLANKWGNRQLTPEQANQLKASVTEARSTFDAGATRTLNRFLNVTLSRITIRQGLGLPANSAKLSWTPPTSNEDGTPLTNLTGYKLFYGASPGNYTKSLDINDPAATSFQVDNLPSGTWYFAMKAVASNGQISRFSGEASKTIP